jgi:solute:Na+ symporter, SSS family
VNKTGAAAGIITGVIMVAYVTITSSTMGTFFPKAPQFIKDLDIGIAALVVNIVFMFAVSAITRTSVKIESEIETEAV